MSDTDSLQITAAATSNTTVETETWNVLFYEVHEPTPPAEGSTSWTYQGRRIASAEGRDKWLYVFQANLDADDQITRTSLQVEGHYDAEGALSLVDWSQGAGQWAGQDARPATVARPNKAIQLTFRTDGSAAGGTSGVTAGDGGRSVYLAFLSHVQLSAVRLDRYFGEWAHRHLLNRALLLDPSSLRSDGTESGDEVGYGPSAADAFQRAGHNWISVTRADGATPLAKAILFDYVDIGAELHAKYSAALTRLDAFDIGRSERTLHAAVTRAVAQAYAESEEEDLSDVPGDPMTKIEAFEAERPPMLEEVDLWGERLFGHHMRLPAFELAREDATDFGTMEQLSEAALDAIDAEVERQADLLDAAGRCASGSAYLREFLADGLSSSWYGVVALAPKVIQRLAKAAVRYYKPGVRAAWTEQKTVAATVQEITDRRVRAQTQLLQATEEARLQRGVTEAAFAVVERKQADVLTALAETVDRPLIQPGSVEYERIVDEILRRSSREGLLDLDAVFNPTRAYPGFRPLPVWDVLQPPGGWVLTGNQPRATFTMLDPRAWRLPGQGGSRADARFRTFRMYKRLPSGIIVLSDGERKLMANVRRALPNRPATPRPPTNAQRRALALARIKQDLLDDAVRTARSEVQDAFSADLTGQEATLRGAAAETELRTTRLTTAGRLVFMLGLYGGVESARALSRELRAGQRREDEGDSFMSAYLGAFAAGANLGAAATGSIDALEAVSRRAALAVADRAKLGIGLKVFGVAAGALTAVAGAFSFAHEWRTHDEAGMAAAALTIASGLAGGVVAYGYVIGMKAAWLPWLGYIGIALAIISILVLLFSNTPLEDWLEGCLWSSEESYDRLSGGALSQRVDRDLRELLKIISVPLVSLEVWNQDPATGEMSIATWGSTNEPVPTHIRLSVRPGFLPGNASLQVSNLRLRLPAIGSRPEVPIGTDVTVQDPTAACYVPAEGDAPGVFVMTWAIDAAALPARAAGFLQMPPAGVGFGCSVSLRFPDGGVSPVTFDLRGNVGYARTFDGTKISIARPVPE